ncbi:MAG: site-2 protease family protein [Deltaproteobacteria bacterium]|nr:site-2 protease family protein [Deltaproteobacteria bacterium]
MDWKDLWPGRRRSSWPESLEEGLFLSPPPRPRKRLNVLLFFLTVLTTVLAGAMQEGVNPLTEPRLIYRGIPFSFSLMGILLAHELGHYLMARRYGLNVTLPYFIPAPSLIGTFGAFIKMRSPVRDRRMLLDVGAAGPLVGVAVSLPFLFLGLKLSEIRPLSGQGGAILGSSLLLSLMNWLVVGPLPEGYDVVIHPVGFAGWIGLLVTSLNLLPVGQLDGGHVAYALLGERQQKIAKLVFASLLALGVLGWEGWLFWSVLLLVMGLRHPPLLDPGVDLDRRRRTVGWFTLALFGITFTPVPFSGF